MSIYHSVKQKEKDVVLANATKIFSFNEEGNIAPPSQLEQLVFAEEKAAAIARLSIDKASRSAGG